MPYSSLTQARSLLLQGLPDFSTEADRLVMSKACRQLKKSACVMLDPDLRVLKYMTPAGYLVRKELLAACVPCMSPQNGPAAVALWLIFEEAGDFELFAVSNSAAKVDDWWSELLPKAHALPTDQVHVPTAQHQGLHVIHCAMTDAWYSSIAKGVCWPCQRGLLARAP